MASERAVQLAYQLFPPIRTIRKSSREIDLIDKALLEERREAEKKTAKMCIEIASVYMDTDEMVDEMVEKFGLEEE